MDNLDHDEYVAYELEIVTVNFIRECLNNGMDSEEIHHHLERYLGTFQ